MLYTILTTIVFMAELIIATQIIIVLLKFDKVLISANDNIVKNKDTINDICVLIRKMSSLAIEFSQKFVDKLNKFKDDSIEKLVSKLLISLLLITTTKAAFGNSRYKKAIGLVKKGLNFIEFVV